MSSSPEKLRLLYLAAENKPGDQRGRIAIFEKMRAEGALEALKVYSYRLVANQHGWGAMWAEVFEAAHDFQPTAIYWQHMTSGEVDEAALEKLKSLHSRPVLCSETGDAYGNFWVKPFSKTFIKFSRHADVTFMSGLGRQVKYLDKHGVHNVHLLPHGFDETSFGGPFPEHYTPEHDVVMIVNRTRSRKPFGEMPGQRERIELIKMLSKEFGNRFALYGNGWESFECARGPVDFFLQHEAYRNAKVGIGGPNFLDIDYYESNRPFNAIGVGIPYVSRFSPGMDRILEDGRHCYFYRRNREAVDIVKRLVSLSDDERLAFGQKAAAFVSKHHSVERRMKTLLKTLENTRLAREAGADYPASLNDFFLQNLEEG